jgi:hypothetical protein
MVTGIRHVTTVPQQALFLMNSPLVINLARRLVAMPAFVDSADDADRLNFLYERIYQRPPNDEEIQLGLEFVNQTPIREDVSDLPNGDTQKQPPGKGKGNGGRRRAPLTSWEEYAQALLQANETSFLN